jgi:hypothetical protein
MMRCRGIALQPQSARVAPELLVSSCQLSRPRGRFSVVASIALQRHLEELELEVSRCTRDPFSHLTVSRAAAGCGPHRWRMVELGLPATFYGLSEWHGPHSEADATVHRKFLAVQERQARESSQYHRVLLVLFKNDVHRRPQAMMGLARQATCWGHRRCQKLLTT